MTFVSKKNHDVTIVSSKRQEATLYSEKTEYGMMGHECFNFVNDIIEYEYDKKMRGRGEGMGKNNSYSDLVKTDVKYCN